MTRRERLAALVLTAVVAAIVALMAVSDADCSGALVVRAWPPGWVCVP